MLWKRFAVSRRSSFLYLSSPSDELSGFAKLASFKEHYDHFNITFSSTAISTIWIPLLRSWLHSFALRPPLPSLSHLQAVR